MPKKLKKIQSTSLPGASVHTDRLYLDKNVIEDIALLFYVIMTIEKNFSGLLRDFRYKVHGQSPDFPPTFKEDLKALFDSITPEKLEVLTCFDDMLEVTRFFEGNITRLFSKFEFHKKLVYVRRMLSLLLIFLGKKIR